jgi:hypothetical protein
MVPAPDMFARLVGMILAARDLSLDGFPAGFEQRLRAACFVLHRDPRGEIDAFSFVTVTLERLLRGLASQTRREQRELRGRVRGRVDWAATWKARLADSHDPTRLVCAEVRRHFDTPENQLLRFMVEALWSLVRTIPPVIRQGQCCRPGMAGPGSLTLAATAPRIGAMEIRLPRQRLHPQLRQIALPDVITPEHLRRAETSKMEEYGQVARLYRRYHRCLILRDWAALAGLGHTLLPLPAHLDGEGEHWLRAAALVLKSLPPDAARAGAVGR